MNSAPLYRACLVACGIVLNTVAEGREDIHAARMPLGLSVSGSTALPIVAPPSTNQLAPLTLGACVRRALSNGFSVEVATQDHMIAQEELPIARSEFEPQLAMSTDVVVTRSREFVDESSDPRIRSDDSTARANLSRKLLSGAVASISTGFDRSRASPAIVASNPAYVSDITLAVRQPLLRGFGSHINLLPTRSAQIGIDLAERNFEDRALALVEATESTYYLLAGSREQLLVFSTGLELAQTLLKEAEARRAAGMATHLDVLQAEVGVANAHLELIDAQKTVSDSEDGLLAVMGRFEFDAPLGPTVLDGPSATTIPSAEHSYELALEHSPTLRATRNAVDLAKLEVEVAQDNLKPFLALELAVGVNGSDVNRDGAYSRMFSADGNVWQAGFVVTYPLGRTADKARLRQANAALARNALRVQQLEQDVLVSVREATRRITATRKSVEIAALAAQLSQRQYEAERARYRAGLSTSRRVLEAQSDLENAQLAHLRTRLDLLRAHAALRRIEGTALDHYGITLSEILRR